MSNWIDDLKRIYDQTGDEEFAVAGYFLREVKDFLLKYPSGHEERCATIGAVYKPWLVECNCGYSEGRTKLLMKLGDH